MSVAFITGGAQGIGAATVKKFIATDIKVAFMDYDTEAGLALQQQYQPEQILFIPGNVQKVTEIETAVKKTIKHFGSLDIVVANAGIFLHKSLLEMTEAEWDRIIDINLKGAIFTIRAALPHLIQNGSGAIVIVASDQCFIAKQNCPAYAASKAALGQITKNLAVDYATDGIRVNAVCPGAIDTPMMRQIIKDWAAADNCPEQEVLQRISNDYLPKRIGKPDEVAELIYFLASEKASFITGSLYPIDGGITAH